ncbi:MAG: hypothetical protein HY270_10550 [Deltaproteobacteria bacterium]|nr:hypothetical protein [Deltaproteobacteria bacterium]
MAETLEACCRRARDTYVERISKVITSYPVIKSIPCPKCRQIIQIRMYGPESPGEAT